MRFPWIIEKQAILYAGTLPDGRTLTPEKLYALFAYFREAPRVVVRDGHESGGLPLHFMGRCGDAPASEMMNGRLTIFSDLRLTDTATRLIGDGTLTGISVSLFRQPSGLWLLSDVALLRSGVPSALGIKLGSPVPAVGRLAEPPERGRRYRDHDKEADDRAREWWSVDRDVWTKVE